MLLVQQNVLKNYVNFVVSYIEDKMKQEWFRSCAVIIIGLFIMTSHVIANENIEQKNTTQISEKKTEHNKELKHTDTNKKTATLESKSHIEASDYLQMILGLMLIVAFIFAISWLIKRVGGLNPNSSNDLKVVAGLSVGQREKIIVVQVVNEQLLVGVTQSNIQLLSKLDTPLEVTNSVTLSNFQEKFQSAVKSFNNSNGSGS